MSDVFLSHSWKDKPLAFRLEADLGGQGVAVWVDHAALRAGQVLVDELQDAIEHSSNLALLWSADASKSRWVKTEWQAAFLLEKPLIPCLLDGTKLPLFLRVVLSCNFQDSYEEGLAALVEALGPGGPGAVRRPEPAPPSPPAPATTPPAPRPGPAPEGGAEATAVYSGSRAAALVRRLYEGQEELLVDLGSGRMAAARRTQAQLAAVVDRALAQVRDHADVLSLAGYHKKNDYLLRHWADVQRGHFPPDPLLEEAENLFHDSLDVRPDNPSAWNGLGSIFLLRGDLDAAEFFVKKALERARAEGAGYGAAEEDLATIRRLKAQPVRAPNAVP